MTKVDFYILDSAQPGDALQYCCRLAEKALKKGLGIYIHCSSEQQASELDNLLWSFSPESFVPHELKSARAKANVVIGSDATAPEAVELLINLAAEIPDFFSRFQRVGEIVCQDESWLQPSRNRYRFYKDRGYPLKTHKIS
ncbi:MAG TPA: DNA polymerase III subunit chi [Spongiibacteraceae bacterium]|nr:DNA polymerase III subunit chi [Spongiibacteraceae bacterium]HCS25909.1 DNA polymerase III subunit chi [Spongiibacteraceae bacterium]|tara:strand:- start:1028 stop:1450 length:423 start_codon:yes stop_codon:yes gene_type:complete